MTDDKIVELPPVNRTRGWLKVRHSANSAEGRLIEAGHPHAHPVWIG